MIEYAIFPTEFIKDCIKTYKENHKKQPKILVVSESDFFDYSITNSIPKASSLGLEEIIFGTYLKPGQIDLAMGVKDKKDKK